MGGFLGALSLLLIALKIAGIWPLHVALGVLIVIVVVLLGALQAALS